MRPIRLTARYVETINKPGRYGDGRGGYGLALLVKPAVGGGVAKSWAQRIRIEERETNIGLGRYPLVTLARARKAALENARMILDGRDPRDRTGRVPTFEAAAEAVIRLHAQTWRDGGKSEHQWRASLATYAYPIIGRKPVSEVTTSDVLAVVAPHWTSKRETMRRVKQRISRVMRWTIAEGHRGDDPAGVAVDAALPQNNVRRTRLRALPHGEVEGALETIRATGAWLHTKLAFEFLVLTACRSGEVRGARWDEVDMEATTWTVPGERMKGGREHRVPLSDAVLAVLREAHAHRDGSGLVFPSVTGRPMSGSTLNKLCRENDIGCVPHGFRSSFRQWAAEQTNFPREVCKEALAHVNSNKVEAAYQRSDLFDKRREIMQGWANYIAA